MQKPFIGEIDIPIKDQVVIEWGTVTGYILELIVEENEILVNHLMI